MNISLFKKLKFFFLYKRTLDKIKIDLEKLYNVRIDEAYRMYTVININNDPSMFQNYGYAEIREYNKNYELMPSHLEQKYLDEMFNKTMKEFSNNISEYLNSKGLSELYVFYQVEKLNKYSYLIILGFSLFRTEKWIKYFFYTVRGLILLAGGIGLIKLLAYIAENFNI